MYLKHYLIGSPIATKRTHRQKNLPPSTLKHQHHRKRRANAPPAKHKIKIFLIGKELKKKDLHKTVAERGKRNGNKTQPKTPDSLRREASQVAGAAPTRVPSMTDSLEVQVLYPA